VEITCSWVFRRLGIVEGKQIIMSGKAAQEAGKVLKA
jgi:hypothetical protein